jgi:ABC-type dipeptide/oligopeptide/nickel transport system permease subunit
MNKKVINKNPLDRHPMLEQLSQLWRNKTAIAGLIIIVVFLLVAIFAPYIRKQWILVMVNKLKMKQAHANLS